MALGPDLCEELGRKERVLKNAPVAAARPLGNGVWLQASASPNSDSTILDPLRGYLAPLLSWTRTDTGGGPPPPATTEPARRPTIYRESAQHIVGRIPTKFMPNAGGDRGLNLYFAETPDPAQRTAIVEAVRKWYALGLTGGFGGSGFHKLNGPTIDGRVMRWRIDFGSADCRRTVRPARHKTGGTR